MAKFRRKKSRLEGVSVLILLGLLSGAVGGAGIGLIQSRAMSQASSASSPRK